MKTLISISITLSVVLLTSCKANVEPESKSLIDEIKEQNQNSEIVYTDNDINIAPVCPERHTDSIIPMIYGFPTEESFQKSDSGLVMLGGCEISDDSGDWWCKIHKLEF